MNRILVTGGAGFIGSHLVDALMRLGHEVVIVDDLSSGKRSNLEVAGTRARFIEADIRQIADLRTKIGTVDAIVHLAALISGHDSLAKPLEYERVNIEGTQAIIDFAGQAKIKRIVFASSSTIYGDQPSGQIAEEQPAAPLTVYALTKLVGEHLLRLYAPIHGFSYCALRLFNVYGPRQSIDHPYANVACRFSHAAARGVPVPLYGDGEQSRDFIYVSDVVDAFLHVLGASGDTVYNVGTGRASSINLVIRLLSNIAPTPLRTSNKPPWQNDIRSISASIEKLGGEFGFRPRVTLEEGLRTTFDSFSGVAT